ncbi:hypothetical protein [Streptomyces monashensis]|uniref:Lipoprotein n=1 Tax=Streptomyces monashensis TaxID=1678012 RepID=A0A1S2PZS7_9ACTN|nr:hypothetical protein [Streptomyces monashensis]OIJ98865.1 hypothetical protein BIV23_29250 [Streptomyces monashensis]
MRKRTTAATAVAVLLTAASVGGCGANSDTGPNSAAIEASSATSSADTAPADWGKGDYEKAMKHLTRTLRDADAELVDSGFPNVMDGLSRTFRTPGDRPYRLDVDCAVPGTDELTLALKRGGEEQDWAVTCNDREADRFNVPAAGEPFTASIAAPDSKTTGIIHWRLVTVREDQAAGDCGDDIKGCDG